MLAPEVPTMHDRDDERRDALPDHELRDEDQVVGGGVMSAGGTAIDRGTGTLGGTAQGNDEDDEESGGLVDGALTGTADDLDRMETPAAPSNPDIDPTRLRR